MRQRRDYAAYLHDMLDAAQKARQFVQGVAFEEFEQNIEKVFAAVRAVEIIGEAAKHSPTALCHRYPYVRWRSITGMRDKVAHEYFEIHLESLWLTVQEDLPPLEAELTQMLADM